MDSPSGTTEQPVSLADRMYRSESEPEADSAETEVEESAEPVEQEAETESVEADSSEQSESVEDEQESEEAEEATESDESDDQVFVMKDGKEVTLKELNDGYLRQSDYTKKTQAIAEERKAIDAEKALIGPKLQILKDIESELGDLVMGDLSRIDWDLLRITDRDQYNDLKEAKEQREQAVTNLKAKRDQLIAEQAKDESVKLHESLGWADAKSRDGDIALIQSYVKASGIPDDVFASVTNHKVMTAILKAAKYDQLQSKKPEIMRKVKNAPRPVGKPAKAAEQAPKSLADRMYGGKKN